MNSNTSPYSPHAGYKFLIAITIIVLAFTVDVATCPRCSGHEIIYAIVEGHDCPVCHSKGKVTVVQFLSSPWIGITPTHKKDTNDAHKKESIDNPIFDFLDYLNPAFRIVYHYKTFPKDEKP